MATNIPFDIIGSFNESDAVEFDPQRLVNLYVDDDIEGKDGKALFTMAGLNLSTGIKLGTSGIKGRRTYVLRENMYTIIGDSIYKVQPATTGLVANFIGKIGSTSGHVGIADNGKEVLFVDGTGGWLFDINASSFTSISGGGFPDQPTDVSVLGGRFVVSQADSAQLPFSGINDGSTWNALDEFAITSQPDIVVGVRRLNDRLFVMGERVTEVWYDAGDPVLPYRRSDVLPYGCQSVRSIAESLGFLTWLSRNDSGVSSVVITTGITPEPISTQAIEKEFQRYDTPSDATAFIYRNERGHAFYQINFTADNKSWAFDINEKRWTQLTYNSADRHLAESHGFINNKHYIVSYNNPYIYELSNNYFTDDGVSIRKRRITPILHDKMNRRIVLHSILFDMKQGVGIPDDVGVDYRPKVRLQVSRDGGITYGNELSTSPGKSGQRKWRTEFFRLGQSRSFVFNILYDNDTPYVLLGSSANITVQEEGT